MAMVEHEIHHRSQLADCLKQVGVEPPQIFGLGITLSYPFLLDLHL